jgi:hypothetical protein
MPVKSYITGHADGQKIPMAASLLRGMAWAGEEHLNYAPMLLTG